MRYGWRQIGGPLAAVGIALLMIAGCSAPRDGRSAKAPTEPIQLAVEGANLNAGAFVAGAGDRVVVTWAATGQERTNVYAASSHDGGITFDAPVRVNDIEGDARISGEQAPRVVLGDDVVVAWISKLAGQSRVRIARSRDGGKTFLPATTPHADDIKGARGWTSLAIDSTQAVHAVWLDGRDAHADSSMPGMRMGAAPPSEHHMRQDIFQSVIKPDGSRTEARVATNVCFCCKTAVAATSNNTTYVAWRHVYPTNLRDIAIARSTDGGKTFGEPVRVSEDHWQIDGCPEDGPAIAVTADGTVHVTWPTIIEGTSRKGIFYTYSTDGGSTFAPRVRIDRDDDGASMSAHPQIASDGAGVSIVWDETTTGSNRVRLQRVTARTGTREWSPARDKAMTVSQGAGNASYPALANSSSGMVVAWTVSAQDSSQIQVRVIPVR